MPECQKFAGRKLINVPAKHWQLNVPAHKPQTKRNHYWFTQQPEMRVLHRSAQMWECHAWHPLL